MPAGLMSMRPPNSPGRVFSAFAAAVVLLPASGSCLGCIHGLEGRRTEPGTAFSPSAFWVPPVSAETEATPAPQPSIPPDLLESAQNWGLPELIDLALRKSPQTREAWSAARAAAASLGSERGSYYPAIALDASITATRGAAVGGRFVFQSTSYGPNLVLGYLLFDFGGRSASVEQARQALIAADWTHNQAIQDVVLKVQQAYYQYLNTKALLQAAQVNTKGAQVDLDAAEQRHQAGVATIADVLQARTSLSQSQLALETVEGAVQTVRGLLATAAGLPASTVLDVQLPSGEMPEPDLSQVSQDVERLIDEAQKNRPELAAARSRVLGSEARIRDVQSTGRPSLTTNLSAGRISFDGGTNATNTYTAGLMLRVPLFNGLSYNYDVRRAREDANGAREQLAGLQQQIVLQVWTSYYNLKTAAVRIGTSKDLLASAEKSYEAASERYKAGVSSIIDLLTAQSQLENARAQQVQARTDWFLSLAQLAHDTGSLGAPTPATHPSPGSERTDQP